MTGSALKLIAIVSMVVDHIGYVFFPYIAIFRIIGRLAFPIFALAAAEGARFTHDRRKYIIRLLLWGLISEIPYDLMGSKTFFTLESQNVCFTLAAGVACIYLLEKKSTKCYVAVIIIMSVTYLAATDYSFIGALAVVIIHHYVVQNKTTIGVCFACLLMSLFFSVQLYSLFVLIPIFFYNGKRGVNLKYLFYVFYPLHMLIIWAVWAFMNTPAI